ncbi:hypothetical protein A2U01_0004431, partial [Trifolium medium]|nr:hypothetical protein [Trifolium medium]
MQLMRMVKDVEDEMKEEDDEGERHYDKRRLGRSENGPGSKFRNGSNQARREITRPNS